MPNPKRTLAKIAKKNPALNKFRKKYVLSRNRFLRKYYSTLSVKDDLILFQSYTGQSYACSPRAIYEYMLASPRYSGYKFVWAMKNIDNYQFLLENERTLLVPHGTAKYYRMLATAKYWVVNAYVPLFVKKKPNQVLIQNWHGTPLKRLRCDIIPDTKHALYSYEKQVESNRIDTSRYDYFVSPSRFASNVFKSAFALEELKKEDILIETGYPRNDILFTFKKSDTTAVKEKLGIPKNKKVILYAPTWRDDQHEKGKGFTLQLEVDFNRLKKDIGDDYIILFRAHYYVASRFDFSTHQGFVLDVSRVDEVNELYIASDILITDYSSVFFDYANLKRPMVFFMYDLARYEKKLRGFYFDVKKELPGPIVKTQRDLARAILSAEKDSSKYKSKYQEFNKKFNYLDDKSASKRVVEKVFNEKRK